jgi:hypothetical protein
MKLPVLLFSTLLIICTSCKKDTPIEQPLKDLLVSGTWTISELVDIIDSTSYAGYTLVFNGDGTMLVNSDTSSANGTWRAYGVNDTEVRLALDPEGDDFLYLESHWTVNSQTSTQIDLQAGFFLVNHMVLVKQ